MKESSVKYLSSEQKISCDDRRDRCVVDLWQIDNNYKRERKVTFCTPGDVSI